MQQNSFRLYGPAGHRRSRAVAPAAALAVLLVSPGALADLPLRVEAPTAALSPSVQAPAPQASAPAADGTVAWLFHPAPSLKPEELDFARNAPLAAAFRWASVLPEPAAEPTPAPTPPAAEASPAVAEAPPLPPLPPRDLEVAQAGQPVPVPLPVPRPAELRAPTPVAPPQTTGATVPRDMKVASLPTAPANTPSFFERLFGGGSAASPVPATGAGTAVYDISARMVYLPNGEKLEAHSGLGNKLDDPRSVNVPMRGATPPGTYDLTEREQLFHGVRAIRLNPVGGSAAIYGRVGLLAHTYMLGPNGDSNGCISFRNYDKFLQAFLHGEVRRLVVVTGRGQDTLPGTASNRFGMRQRSGSSARDT